MERRNLLCQIFLACNLITEIALALVGFSAILIALKNPNRELYSAEIFRTAGKPLLFRSTLAANKQCYGISQNFILQSKHFYCYRKELYLNPKFRDSERASFSLRQPPNDMKIQRHLSFSMGE